MRHRFNILATIMLLTAFAAATPCATAAPKKKDKTENAATGAAVTFKDKTYDFGYVPEDGGPVSHIFEFVNTGDAPLVIISATASCGCTRPTYPTEPIAPGKKGQIKVTYLPQGRPGEFNKAVKVRTNAKSAKKFALTIKGTVVKK